MGERKKQVDTEKFEEKENPVAGKPSEEPDGREKIEHLGKENLEDVWKIGVASFAPEFHLTKQKLCENAFDAPDFFKEGSLGIRDAEGVLAGFILSKISLEDVVYPNTGWISIFAVAPEKRCRGVGHRLLESALQAFKEKGIERVYLGQDYRNFFSGIPSPSEEKIRFFAKEGFWINNEDHYDLEADIVSNEKIRDFDPDRFLKNFSVTTFSGEKKELLAFLDTEFPGRWVFEAETAMDEGKASEEIVLLWTGEKQELVGYCMLDGVGKEYGGLGPIGIAKKIRGNHVGDFMLWASLRQLEKIGVRTVNIDWTILKDFYGKFGFVPERVYRGACKDI